MLDAVAIVRVDLAQIVPYEGGPGIGERADRGRRSALAERQRAMRVLELGPSPRDLFRDVPIRLVIDGVKEAETDWSPMVWRRASSMTDLLTRPAPPGGSQCRRAPWLYLLVM